MVHAAHASLGIANTGCDTRAEDRRDHRVRVVADAVLALRYGGKVDGPLALVPGATANIVSHDDLSRDLDPVRGRV